MEKVSVLLRWLHLADTLSQLEMEKHLPIPAAAAPAVLAPAVKADRQHQLCDPQASGSSWARRPRRVRGGLRQRAHQRDQLLGSRRGRGVTSTPKASNYALGHTAAAWQVVVFWRTAGLAGEFTGAFWTRPVMVPTYVTNRSRRLDMPRAHYSAAKLSRRRIAAC
jgi:hypothetical protein